MRGAGAGVQDSVVETLASARTSNRCGVRVTHQAPTHHLRTSHNDRPLPCLGQRQRRRLPNRGRGQRPAPDRACPSRARQARPASRPGLHQPALERDVLQVEGHRSDTWDKAEVHPGTCTQASRRGRTQRQEQAVASAAAVDGDRQRSEPVGRSCSTGTAPARTQPPSPGDDRSGQHGGLRLRSPMMRRTCTAPAPGTRAPESQARSSSGQKMGKRTFSYIAGR
jgi:hypothetical protein